MQNFKTIKEFHEAVKSGQIDETQIEIVLDNDSTSFYFGASYDDNGNDIENEINIEEANGYADVEPLYSLLFPNAKVGWC